MTTELKALGKQLRFSEAYGILLLGDPWAEDPINSSIYKWQPKRSTALAVSKQALQRALLSDLSLCPPWGSHGEHTIELVLAKD